MSEILLVSNPKRRRKARKTRARKATRRKRTFVAAGYGVGRVPKRRKRAKRRSSRTPRGYTVGRAPIRRRKTNPSLRGLTSSVVPTLKAAAIGAGGAIGLDLLWGYGVAALPDSIRLKVADSPLIQYAAKLAGAIAVGMAGNLLLKGRGRDLAVGAATVVLHDAAKAQLKASVPSLQLGEYLTVAPSVGYGRLERSNSVGMGQYLSDYAEGCGDGSYAGDQDSNYG